MSESHSIPKKINDWHACSRSRKCWPGMRWNLHDQHACLSSRSFQPRFCLRLNDQRNFWLGISWKLNDLSYIFYQLDKLMDLFLFEAKWMVYLGFVKTLPSECFKRAMVQSWKKILWLFHILAQFLFTKSERKQHHYHQMVNIQNA